MKLVLVADTFPPFRTSGAVQLRDLSHEMVRQGHELTVILPDSTIDKPWVQEYSKEFTVLRLKSPKTKDVSYIRRTFGELAMPYMMLMNLNKSPFSKVQWEGVVWYSPSIFFGPLVSRIKKKSAAPGYLIIRDIFPEWAVDMGLMSNGLPYLFFKQIARKQYAAADVIGIQTPGNTVYFSNDALEQGVQKVEVLQNWLADTEVTSCSVDINKLGLGDKIIFVYAGNMGVAQGMDAMLSLAEGMQKHPNVGFLFVGRGSERDRLKATVQTRKIANVVFVDEIEPDEIPGLYKQCHIGLVSLHPSHRTHNIPGKFLTYMQSGLPVLANVNPDNDLIDVITQAQVGQVCADGNTGTLVSAAEELVEDYAKGVNYRSRCRSLYKELFSPHSAVEQIVNALTAERENSKKSDYARNNIT